MRAYRVPRRGRFEGARVAENGCRRTGFLEFADESLERHFMAWRDANLTREETIAHSAQLNDSPGYRSVNARSPPCKNLNSRRHTSGLPTHRPTGLLPCG